MAVPVTDIYLAATDQVQTKAHAASPRLGAAVIGKSKEQRRRQADEAHTRSNT